MSTAPIKILHTEWADGWGGQELRILSEMIGVREQGMEVAIACTAHSNINRYAREHGFQVFNLPFRGTADFGTMWGLMRIIRRHGFDIVNTHSGKDTWVGGFAAKLTGRKFIRTRHLGYKVNTSRLNFINEMADFIMTTGENVRQGMIKHNRIKPEKIRSIPTGIDDAVFDPKQYDKTKAREALGLPEDALVVGTVANLRHAKRIDLWLDAAAQILKVHPEARFVIGGTGPVEEIVKQKARDLGIDNAVTWPGFTDTPAKYMAAFDIYLLTSDDEGVPQAVMQALMMRLPTVATKAGSTEDLHHDDNFILLECGDVPAIVREVLCLVEDKKLRQYYSKRSRAFVLAHFSKTVMIEAVLDVYRKVMQP